MNFMVAKELKGFHRLQPTKDFRSPVTLKILEKLVNTVSTIVGDNTSLLQTMYSLNFFTVSQNKRNNSSKCKSNKSPALT